MSKYLFPIIFLLSYTRVHSQCMDINWINPLPQGNHIVGLHVVSDDTVYCAGEGGTFLRTYDGGQTWFNNRIKYFDVYDVHFVNGTIGFACGFGASYGRVYKTQDAGQTWFEVFQTPSPQQTFYQVVFTDVNTGYAAGWPGGTIYKTTDGGLTWTGKSSGGTGYIYSLQFVSPSRGIAMVANSQVSITTDGGDTWTKQNLIGNPTITAMHFADSLHGFIATSANTDAYKTTDGGNTWTTIAHPLPWFRRDVYFTSKDTGYVASSSFDVQVSKTVDGGATWSTQIVSTVFNGVQIAFSPDNKNIGYLTASAGKIMKTTDGGITWNNLSSGFYNYLYDMQFVGDSTVYVCSSKGFINKSTDLGNTWTSLTTGTTKQISAMHFINDSVGIAIGDQGLVIKTSNAGTTWSTKNGQNSLYQYDVQFINNQLGLLCGTSGLIRRSTDGGDTWNIINSGVNHLLTKIFMVNADTMYVAADSGRVLRSIDGGQTWVQTFTNYNSLITGLHFFNGTHGICGNDAEYIYRTYDAGQTWTEIYDGWGAPVDEFTFLNEQEGYYLQSDLSNANILRTTDGGDTWAYTDFNIADELTTLTLHKGELYACGYFGKIIKISPHIISPVVQPIVACGQGSYTITVTSTYPVYWFNFPYYSNPIDSGLSFTTPFLTTDDTFYVAAYDAASQCYSLVMPVLVNLQAIPAVSYAVTDSLCNYTAPYALYGGTPAGGVYTGTGISNNIFDPAQAQFGINNIVYTYTDSNGCAASAAGSVFVSSCTAVEEVDANTYFVYPTITRDFVYLKSNVKWQENINVKIISADGKLSNVMLSTKSFALDLRNYASGIYTIVINAGSEVIQQRVAKVD